MDCERKGCGHPLAFHDPCSICDCPGYEPAERKRRAAMLTDTNPPSPATKRAMIELVKQVRADEQRRLGHLS